MSTEINKDILRGGQFLVKETACEDIFTPEDFSEEQTMMKESVKEFIDREVWPQKERFEKKEAKYPLISFTLEKLKAFFATPFNILLAAFSKAIAFLLRASTRLFFLD